MAKWHDKVNDKVVILATAQRLTDRESCYVVNKYRYGAELHRRALQKLLDKKLLKRIQNDKHLMCFIITDKGREELKKIKETENAVHTT